MTADGDGPSAPGEGTGNRSFVRAAALSFATNVAVAALGLLNVLIMARALGPQGRGEIAFLMTVALVTAAIGSCGLEQANANLAASQPQLRRHLGGNSLVLALVIGAAAGGVVALLAELLPAVGGEVSTGLLWLALGSVPVLLLQTYLTALVQAAYAFHVWNVAWLLTPVTSVIGNASLAAAGQLTPGRSLVLWIGGQLVSTIVLAAYVGRRLAGFGGPDLTLAKQALRFGLRSHPGRVMTASNYRMDQWFVGSIAGSRELGIYSVAVALSETLFFLPTVLARVQRPDLARAARDDAGSLATLVFRSSLLLTLPLALVLVAAGPVLTVWLFGGSFREASGELRVLTLGAFGIAALKLLGDATIAQRRPGLSTIGVAIAFALTVGLDLALIPHYGAMGAAIASTCAYTAGGIGCAFVFSRVLGVPMRELVPRPSDATRLLARLRTRTRSRKRR